MSAGLDLQQRQQKQLQQQQQEGNSEGTGGVEAGVGITLREEGVDWEPTAFGEGRLGDGGEGGEGLGEAPPRATSAAGNETQAKSLMDAKVMRWRRWICFAEANSTAGCRV